MSYPLRIETTNLTSFCTSKLYQDQIWFTQDNVLEDSILGHLAQRTELHGVELYAFAMEGTHKHELAAFRNCNRAKFFQEFNAATSRSIKRRYPDKLKRGGGSLFKKRYAHQFLVPRAIESLFFYTVLQPVNDGIVDDLSKYPGYNCFEDAVHGVARDYEVVNWTAYNAARRRKKPVDIKLYTRSYQLKYKRLPGYERYSQNEYAKCMKKKLKEYARIILNKRKKSGKGFMKAEDLLKVVAGMEARNPKKLQFGEKVPKVIGAGDKESYRMICILIEGLEELYNKAAKKIKNRKNGDSLPKFPAGMYSPLGFTGNYRVTLADIT